MYTRKGRLNLVIATSSDVIHKIAIVRENARPSRLAVETWAMTTARKKGLNVPKILSYHRNQAGEEELLAERVAAGTTLTKLTKREKTRCLFRVGTQMKLLKDISSGYGWINPITHNGLFESWKSFLASYVTTYGHRLTEAEILTHAEIAKMNDEIISCDLSLREPHLVHRDLKLGNLLIDGRGKVWIVDWENAILGDPLYDLAIFGISHGRGDLWSALAKGWNLRVDPQRYKIYEAIALLGVIDFCRRYRISNPEKIRRLRNILKGIS